MDGVKVKSCLMHTVRDTGLSLIAKPSDFSQVFISLLQTATQRLTTSREESSVI